MDISREFLRTLSQVGYLACFKGRIGEGEAIMEGAYAAQPEQIPTQVGLAIARICTGQYVEAVDILRDQVLAVEPNHMTAKCFMGLALKQTGQKEEATRLLQEVSQRGSSDEKAIASAYLVDEG